MAGQVELSSVFYKKFGAWLTSLIDGGRGLPTPPLPIGSPDIIANVSTDARKGVYGQRLRSDQWYDRTKGYALL